jgi:hypothetical protein
VNNYLKSPTKIFLGAFGWRVGVMKELFSNTFNCCNFPFLVKFSKNFITLAKAKAIKLFKIFISKRINAKRCLATVP